MYGKKIQSVKTRLSVRNFDLQDVLDFYSDCEKQTSMSYIQIDGQSQKENECVSLIFQSRTRPQFCYEPGVTRK